MSASLCHCKTEKTLKKKSSGNFFESWRDWVALVLARPKSFETKNENYPWRDQVQDEQKHVSRRRDQDFGLENYITPLQLVWPCGKKSEKNYIVIYIDNWIKKKKQAYRLLHFICKLIDISSQTGNRINYSNHRVFQNQIIFFLQIQ